MSMDPNYDGGGLDEGVFGYDGGFEAEPAMPYNPPPAISPAQLDQAARALRDDVVAVARAEVQAGLAGPTQQLLEQQQAQQVRELSEMVDRAEEEIASRQPGASALLHDPGFAAYVSSQPIDGSSQAGITRGLEDALVGFRAVRATHERAQVERERQAAWNEIKGADSGRWRGSGG